MGGGGGEGRWTYWPLWHYHSPLRTNGICIILIHDYYFSLLLYKFTHVALYFQGFFWPVLTTDIRSCSQCQKVCFFPIWIRKFPIQGTKKTGEKITKYHHFTMFMFVVERAGPNSPNDTREITKYCKLPNGNVPLRQFSRIYSRRCRGNCNKHTWFI